jgi:tRNA G46 methylase TrmB
LKNTIKYLFQRLLGYPRYLVWFAHYKIHTLRKDNQEKDFFYFLSLIQPEKGAILDVGANIGIMTYHLSKEFPSNLIYAFEPIPSNIQALNTIIERYELSNVRL